MVSDDLEMPDDVATPIHVSEMVLTAYQWDHWREAALRGSHKDDVISILVGIAAALAGAALGLDLFNDEAARLSVLVYAPGVGAGVWFWARSWLRKRHARRVADEVRAHLVPAVVRRISDYQVFTLLKLGGATVAEESTLVRSVRHDAAVTLIASEYDMSLYPDTFSGDASGGG